MKARDKAALFGHLAQHKAASICQGLAALGGLALAIKHGLAGVIVGAVGVWLFGLAKPGPSAELDKLTRRGGPDDPN